MFKTVKCRDGPARAAPSHLFFSLPSTRRKNVARGSKKSRATFWKTIGNGWKNYGQCFPKLRATLFKITSNRIYAYQQPYLSPQLGKNFFLTGKIITAGRDARSLRPDCVRIVPRLRPNGSYARAWTLYNIRYWRNGGKTASFHGAIGPWNTPWNIMFHALFCNVPRGTILLTTW